VDGPDKNTLGAFILVPSQAEDWANQPCMGKLSGIYPEHAFEKLIFDLVNP